MEDGKNTHDDMENLKDRINYSTMSLSNWASSDLTSRDDKTDWKGVDYSSHDHHGASKAKLPSTTGC